LLPQAGAFFQPRSAYVFVAFISFDGYAHAMATTADDIIEPVELTEADARALRDSMRRLAPALGDAGSTIALRVGQQDDLIVIPAAAFRLFVRILDEMATGNAVRLMPQQVELTTQEAADILNVSRPYVVRLLDSGRITSHRVGTHRRVLLKDVMAYKDEQLRARGAALDRLSALDQELGLI